MTCAECGAKLVKSHLWKRLPSEQRALFRANGYRPHSGHGLCDNCYRRDRHPRTSLTRKVFLTEWKHFYDPTRSQNWNIQNLAKILRRTPASIESAILRAKREGEL